MADSHRDADGANEASLNPETLYSKEYCIGTASVQ